MKKFFILGEKSDDLKQNLHAVFVIVKGYKSDKLDQRNDARLYVRKCF